MQADSLDRDRAGKGRVTARECREQSLRKDQMGQIQRTETSGLFDKEDQGAVVSLDTRASPGPRATALVSTEKDSLPTHEALGPMLV